MNKTLQYSLMICALLIISLLAMSIGAVHIPISELLQLLIVKPSSSNTLSGTYDTILFTIRIPRVLLSLLIGAALGMSGASIQAIFRNPLAEPGLLGISAGASLSAVLVIVAQAAFFSTLGSTLGYFVISLAALIGALLTALLIYHLSAKAGKPNVATMLLIGIAINALCTSVTGLITANAEESELRNITFWMLGSLAGASWQVIWVVSPFILTALFFLPFQADKLNAFALGESQAEQLGVKTTRVKRTVIVLCTLAVGASVAVSGVIGFVGLLVPHLVRLIGGVNNKFVLPASALLGATTLCLADLTARIISAPIDQPIGVITALVGSPVFLYMLLKDKKKYPDA